MPVETFEMAPSALLPRWYKFSKYRLMECLSSALYLLFFATGFVFIETHINFSNVLFILLALLFGLQLLFVRKVVLSYVLICIGYLFLLLLSLCVTLVVGIPIQYGAQEMLYYLKPVFFFIFGYCFFDQKRLEQLYLVVLIYMAIGTVAFYTDPMFFIKETLLKIGDVEQKNTGFLYAFSLFIRNTSFLLSALETSFVMFFITYHYYYKFWYEPTRKYFFYFTISSLILLTAIARSSIIGLLLAMGVHIFIVVRPFKKTMLMCVMVTAAVLVVSFFKEEIVFLLFKDNSASIHNDNLLSAISHITSSWFLPSGLGSSGWVTAGMPFNIYSEGSIFTSVIENGSIFLIAYLGVLYITFTKSKDYLFPVFLGYLLAALLIPIGFSTLFNLLFFVALGSTLCTCCNKTPQTLHTHLTVSNCKDMFHE